MLEIQYQVFNKNNGDEVKRDVGIFESIDALFFLLKVKYGYDSRNYRIQLCGGRTLN